MSLVYEVGRQSIDSAGMGPIEGIHSSALRFLKELLAELH